MAELTNVDFEGLNDYSDDELKTISNNCNYILSNRKHKKIEDVLKAIKDNFEKLNQLCDNPCVYFTGDLSLEEMIDYIKSGKRNIQQVLDEYSRQDGRHRSQTLYRHGMCSAETRMAGMW